jgi:hypothetical protein
MHSWEKEVKKKQEAMEGLLPKQLEVIKETHQALLEAADNIENIHDLHLSDVRHISEQAWALSHWFNLEEKGEK